MKQIALRGMLASVLKRITFANGEVDIFDGSFSELSPHIKRQYEVLAEHLKGLYPQQSLPFTRPNGGTCSINLKCVLVDGHSGVCEETP